MRHLYEVRLFFALFLIGVSLWPRDQALAQGTRTEVSLLLEVEAATPGQTFLAGVRLKMPPRWHSYWRNGGDSGKPTKIVWSLPAAITAGDVQWPVPEKNATPAPVLTTYVYHDEVVLIVPLTVGKEVPKGAQEIKATVTWQECEKLCLSGKTEVQAKINISDATKPSAAAAQLKEAQQKLPSTNTTEVVVHGFWEPPTGDERFVTIEATLKDKPGAIDFFPYSAENYDVAGATESLAPDGGKFRIRKKVEKSEGEWPKELHGLLATRASAEVPWNGTEVSIPLSEGASKPKGGAAAQSLPSVSLLGRMMGYAFLGGLILNIMPCVLPVIALKIFSFVKQSQESPARIRSLGLIYGFGVLVSFLILAGVAIGIQGAGRFAGWSTAFQYPQFRLILTALMLLVALNLFGVFEITLGGSAMGAAAQLTSRSGASGAFFNGVLATILATPCTAPFLGAAVGFAFTQKPVVILLTFLMVGLGLAFPFVLLCWHPAWMRWLPKPGAWMERFKVAMGFPMLGTAIWLFWLSATRYGKGGVLWVGLFLVALALGAWIWGEFIQRLGKRRLLAGIILFLVVGGAYGYVLEGKLNWRHPGAKNKEAIEWKPWSAEAVVKAQEAGRPVLVDFTADGCLNCKWNKLTSIDIDATRAKLKEINAVTLEGDFTDNDEKIAEELRKFGRPGVPLVLVYSKKKEEAPIVLPEKLSPKLVLDALEKASR